MKHGSDVLVDQLCAVIFGSRDETELSAGALEGLLEHGNLLQQADYHGVVPLLWQRISSSTQGAAGPFQSIKDQAIARALWESGHQIAINQALEALSANAVVPLLFKGTALAYSLYSEPYLRSRSDTDMLVEPQLFDKAGRALEEAGFAADSRVPGSMVSYQQGYSRMMWATGPHIIDLHRRINNSQLIAMLFTYDELHEASVPVARLSANARAIGPVHALMIACLHPATHRRNPYYVDSSAFFGSRRLIWYYDIHLLASHLTPADWSSLQAIAAEKGMGRICADGLDISRQLFGTFCPDHIAADLRRTGQKLDHYFNVGSLHASLIDFAAIPSIRERMQFLRELVLPPSSYMLAKYKNARLRSLPWLYVRRMFEGMAKRLANGD